MRLSESITIDAPVATVWDAISQPVNWPGFVAKIQTVEALDNGFYRIEIGGKEVLGKIASLDSFKRMCFAGQLTNQSKQSEFLIEYRLDADTRCVVVTEIQEFELPFLVSLLVKFLWKYGKKQSESNLELLKKFCESSAAESP